MLRPCQWADRARTVRRRDPAASRRKYQRHRKNCAAHLALPRFAPKTFRGTEEFHLQQSRSVRPICHRRFFLRALAEDAGLADEWAASRNRGVHHSEEPISMQAEFVMERPTK